MSTTIGKAVTITGSVHAGEPVAISGTVNGDVVVMNGTVTIESDGRVEGSVTAREVVIRGAVAGRLVATDVVRLQPGCRANAEIAASRLAIEDGATFNGKVEPARAEAAARVAAYRQGEARPAADATKR
jgi:cytoskeletal protein CcmA (bactofilin family)